jgi:hypothetical protein
MRIGRPLGVFTSGFGDMGEFERKHAARDKDADWPAYLQASEHLITAQENRLIRTIDLPSLRAN